VQQQQLLRQAQQNPLVLDQEANKAREQIRAGQAQAINQAQGEALLGRSRIGIRSFLLAIGFISIGWTGLRDSR
jgi:hypothetical protein